MFRQGDILLRRIASVPNGARRLRDQHDARILARGEKTGHMHIMRDGTVYETSGPGGPRKIIQVDAPTQLIHDEHAAIDVPPGIWELVQQRTYIPADGAAPDPLPGQPATTKAGSRKSPVSRVVDSARNAWRDASD